MEKNGIGTDASIPVHINNICERNYVQVQAGRRLAPTALGISLIRGYQCIDLDLCLPDIQSFIEQQITLVAKGQADHSLVVQHVIQQFKGKFSYFVKQVFLCVSLSAPVSGGWCFIGIWSDAGVIMCHGCGAVVWTRVRRRGASLWTPPVRPMYLVRDMTGTGLSSAGSSGDTTLAMDSGALLWILILFWLIAEACYISTVLYPAPALYFFASLFQFPTSARHWEGGFTRWFIGAINGVLEFGIITSFKALVVVASSDLHRDVLLKANFGVFPTVLTDFLQNIELCFYLKLK
ncbi:DNA topoisomerase 3-beta [Camellia lanceoleosa]|uniref:DNA topoisomerase 3-beta n=1 Tax=Camellia lanceoleosa TaxID=1840588 RepID=A0ACC0HVY8_9ERIC|nr:DNA topoisomerase 3-beta [Camellia lanceoleosa]